MQEKRLAEQIRNAVKKKKDEALQAFDKHLQVCLMIIGHGF